MPACSRERFSNRASEIELHIRVTCVTRYCSEIGGEGGTVPLHARCYSERRAPKNSVCGSATISARPLISANKVRAITDKELRHRDQDGEEGASLQRTHPCAMRVPPVKPNTLPPYPFCSRIAWHGQSYPCLKQGTGH